MPNWVYSHNIIIAFAYRLAVSGELFYYYQSPADRNSGVRFNTDIFPVKLAQSIENCYEMPDGLSRISGVAYLYFRFVIYQNTETVRNADTCNN